MLFFKELKKKIVYESIREYLNKIVILDIENMNNIFQTKQSNKHYILYHNNNFYQDTINNDELTIINIINIENIKTNTKIAMLLYKSFFIRTKNIFCPL